MIPRFSADISGAREYLKQLQGKEIPRVIGRSLDRTAKSTNSFSSRYFRSRVALDKKTVDKGLSYRRSGEIQNLTALNLGRAWFEQRISGKPIGIRDFAARKVAAGVTYRVSKAGPRQRYVRKGQPAFFVKRFGNHVFTRVGPDPPGPDSVGIKKAVGPSLPQFAATKRYQRAAIAHAEKVWATEVITNARFALSRRQERP